MPIKNRIALSIGALLLIAGVSSAAFSDSVTTSLELPVTQPAAATEPAAAPAKNDERPTPPVAATPVAAEPVVEAPAEVRSALDVIEGSASYYSDALAGRSTASGVPYDPTALVAAHKRLPFGTVLRVTNLLNDRSVEVRVVDRGPFARGRVIDLSRSAAERIGMIRRGHAPVRIEVLSYGG